MVGGSGGIGLAVARGCVEESLGVTLVARRQGRLDRATASLGDAVKVAAVVADAGSPVALDQAVAEHERVHGGLDVVVVAVGGGRPGTAVETSADDLTAALARDVDVPWQVLRSSIGALRDTAQAQGVARFVVVGSVAGLAPVSGFAAYSAAKAALRSLALSIEHDESPSGIRATVIEPGYVATPLTAIDRRPARRHARARRRRARGQVPLEAVAAGGGDRTRPGSHRRGAARTVSKRASTS